MGTTTQDQANAAGKTAFSEVIQISSVLSALATAGVEPVNVDGHHFVMVPPNYTAKNISKEVEEAQPVPNRKRNIRDQIEQYALTFADLFPGKTRGKSKRETKTVAPKYRDPASGAQWSGRGVAPIWIKGQDRERFLIK